MWEVSDQEFAAVTALPAPRRYDYFAKKLADWQRLWSLGDEAGFVAAADDDGRDLLPVWPHPAFAAACATGDWEGQEPVEITLDEWLTEILPMLERDGTRIAVFQTPQGQAVHVDPERLRHDLEDELSQYS
jgi:hypothetical protein